MSEREEQIFKEHSTNKISSLNTPSKTIGGLEGRRILSDDIADKANLKKTKKHFLQTQTEKLKRLKKQSTSLEKNPPEPTERDMVLLEQLESFGILSTQQIREIVFNNIDTRTVLRRLRLLKQRGWLLSSEGLPNGGMVWVLSRKGALLFNPEGETKPINRNTLKHDAIISDIRIQLERLGIVESWTPEHILKKKATKTLYEWEKKSFSRVEDPPTVPDSLFITKQKGEMKAVALELELSLKSKTRYKKIFSRYKKKEELWCVWYVVLNKSVGESLIELWDKYALWGDCMFAYSTLKEIFKSFSSSKTCWRRCENFSFSFSIASC